MKQNEALEILKNNGYIVETMNTIGDFDDDASFCAIDFVAVSVGIGHLVFLAFFGVGVLHAGIITERWGGEHCRIEHYDRLCRRVVHMQHAISYHSIVA